MATLEEAVNIGPVLAEELRQSGFETLEDMRAAGYLEAIRRLRAVNPERDCANSALAVAGAIQGVRWMKLPPEERRRILAEVNTLLAAENSGPAIT